MVDVTAANSPPTGLEFQTTDTKLYVPVVTFSKKKRRYKLLEQLKSGFHRTVKWDKYRSQMTIQPQNDNLIYLTDPTFTKGNRLFCRLQELLPKIIEIFYTIMYQMSE